MNLGLEGKVALVAGSSRGIGKGIASVFLEEGSRVVLTGRDPAALEATRAEFSAAHPGRVMAFEGDLAERQTAVAACREVAGHWGSVDVLVCNIGSGTSRNGWQLSGADWDAAFRINLWASVGLIEVFLPAMVEAGRGSIILIGSIAGRESIGAPSPYGAAKAALEHYSKDLARRVAAHGVRVNTIAPGNILFRGGSWQRKLDADADSVKALIDREVPLGRFGAPEEIGAAAAFLASERAAFVTGACLVVDGGQTRA